MEGAKERKSERKHQSSTVQAVDPRGKRKPGHLHTLTLSRRMELTRGESIATQWLDNVWREGEGGTSRGWHLLILFTLRRKRKWRTQIQFVDFCGCYVEKDPMKACHHVTGANEDPLKNTGSKIITDWRFKATLCNFLGDCRGSYHPSCYSCGQLTSANGCKWHKTVSQRWHTM